MRFEELLEEFRTLGGIVENVRRGVGPYGPGIFPVDPRLPVRLHASENVLFPTEDLELRDGNLTIRAASSLGDGERHLFEALQQYFGWSAGGFENLWASQMQWSRLPADVIAFIKATGAVSDPDFRFAEPSDTSCLYQFVKSRDVSYKGRVCIMPVVDLVNHSSGAKPFVIDNGIGVQGTFPGEVLVRYNVADSWANALIYGFPDNAFLAYSLPITVDLFGSMRLSIRRGLAEPAVDANGIRFPRKHVEGNTIDFSFMLLGNARQPDLPRGMFRKLMNDHLTPQQADEVFDSIVRFNNGKFLNGLRMLRKHDLPLVRMLEDAAINQLDALCASVGARAL